MKARLARHCDGPHIAQIESFVLLPESHRAHRKKVIRTHPNAGPAQESAAMAGQLAIGYRVHARVLMKYATPAVHPAISARAIDIPSTVRHRLRRTMLRGRFQVAMPSTSAAGAAAMVSGHI